jgi:purine-nucleoside phosphorylase
VEAELDYHEIDGFPVSTVPGHAGKFIFGWIGSVPVVCMKGRVHFYEGYPVSDVVLPIRLMKRMGAELLFVKSLRFQNCSLYFLGMQRLFDVIDGF